MALYYCPFVSREPWSCSALDVFNPLYLIQFSCRVIHWISVYVGLFGILTHADGVHDRAYMLQVRNKKPTNGLRAHAYCEEEILPRKRFTRRYLVLWLHYCRQVARRRLHEAQSRYRTVLERVSSRYRPRFIHKHTTNAPSPRSYQLSTLSEPPKAPKTSPSTEYLRPPPLPTRNLHLPNP